jgi:2-keto-4-pentenoate hydratase/2-oxohepta-3-ene-1,7-dioic acid hydratase in catechol pathway
VTLYCRFQAESVEAWGVVEDHQVWEVTPDIFSPMERTGRSFPMQEVRFLAPCRPSKIIAIGLNYKEHIKEFGRSGIPAEPVLFLKAPSAVINPGEPILLPAGVEEVHYEAELGVVISKTGRHLTEAQAMDHVLGFTCVNDVTARSLQKKDVQWARAKSFDTFAPIGPWIADGLPAQNLRIETYVNERVVQQDHTSQMIFPVARLVSFVSSVMTLYPGDIISTGTPPGVGPMKAGDVVDIFIEGIGRLRNPVQNER